MYIHDMLNSFEPINGHSIKKEASEVVVEKTDNSPVPTSTPSLSPSDKDQILSNDPPTEPSPLISNDHSVESVPSVPTQTPAPEPTTEQEQHQQQQQQQQSVPAPATDSPKDDQLETDKEHDEDSASPPSSPNSQQPPIVCQNCHTSTTPLWRRDENGQVLCNACGLFLKLHGRRRPISLKTDVIKSRNRSKNNPVAIKRTKNNQQSQLHMPNSPGINGGSPSFAAISPHMGPHGSPLNHPSHNGSPLIHSPLRHAMLHDINNIDNMPLSGPNHNDRPQNLPLQRAIIPSTPSTMFYSNSPTLPPHGGPPLPPHPMQQQPPPHIYGHMPPHPHHMPLQQPPPLLQQQQHPQQPPQQQPTQQQPPPHLQQQPPHLQQPHQHQLPPPQIPSGYTSLPGSGRASPKSFSPNDSSQLSMNMQQNGGLRPLPRPLSNGPVSGPGPNRPFPNSQSTPHILTPQSRPQSPVNPPSHGLALRPLRFPGESVSEQLRPRSPDVKLDRIPSLRNIPASVVPTSARTPPPAPQTSAPPHPSTTSPKSILNPPQSPNSSAASLATRISELELINDLLRSRVAQLEASEATARQAEATIRESELLMRKRIELLQGENKRLREVNENGTKETNEPNVKRIKVSELL